MKKDEQLVEDFIGGDEQAFETLVDRYLKPLYNFTFQFAGDRTASEDIVQDVLVKVWKNLEKFDGQKKFSTWIYAIAKNTVFDWLKKKKVLPFSVFENSDETNLLETIEDRMILNSTELWRKMDNVQEAQQFLDALSPEMKTVFLLHFQQGFSLAEIAEIFGQSNNTVKSQFRRALFSLREKFSANRLNTKPAPKTVSAS
jgi:RNA polymerase sigma-70 factor, ECF subfamily